MAETKLENSYLPRTFGNARYTPVILSVFVVVAFFLTSYSLFGVEGLPIGWDTPRYVSEIQDIQKNGVLNFILDSGGYNFVYPIIGYLLTLLSFGAMQVEIFFPVVLCGLVVIAGSRSKLIPSKFGVALVLSLSSWFALYRLGADLHSNLLSLFLLLISVRYFVDAFSGERYSYVKVCLLILVSSFTHVETTIFFVLLFAATCIVEGFVCGLKTGFVNIVKRIAPIVLASSLAAFLFVSHLLELSSYSSGVIVVRNALEPWKFAAALTVLFPFALVGLYIILKEVLKNGNYSRGYLFLFLWGVASFLLGVSQYLFPSFQIFSERALILLPTPFLAAVCAGYNSRHILFKSLGDVNLVSLALTLFVACTVFGSMAPLYQRTFISSSAYEKLLWVKDNLSEGAFVLVYNDRAEYAGDRANFADNWAEAVVGEHYSYLGLPDYLVYRLKTPFENLKAIQQSNLFYGELSKGNLLSGDTEGYGVVVIEDFFFPGPPDYFHSSFRQVKEGVFVSSLANADEGNVTITLPFSTLMDAGDPYYVSSESWAESHYALTLSESVGLDSRLVFSVLVPLDGIYQFSLRFMDADGGGVRLFIDSELFAEISYTSTDAPRIFSFNTDLSANIKYTVTIEPFIEESKNGYLSLDYLSLTLR